MNFHLAPLSLTLSDLERSIQVTRFSMAYISTSIQDNHRVTMVMDMKSYMRFHLAQLSMALSDLERSNRGQAYFRGP